MRAWPEINRAKPASSRNRLDELGNELTNELALVYQLLAYQLLCLTAQAKWPPQISYLSFGFAQTN